MMLHFPKDWLQRKFPDGVPDDEPCVIGVDDRSPQETAMRERLIEVCDKCYRASCWHGNDLCDHAIGAGTTKIPENQLRAMGFEHPDNFSRDALRRVFGDKAPHGYAP